MSDITTTAGNEIEALTKERDSLLLRLSACQLELEAAKRERDTVALVGGKALTELHDVVGRLDSCQAKLDAVMLEYCPGEMTSEQVENWEAAQRSVIEAEGGWTQQSEIKASVVSPQTDTSGVVSDETADPHTQRGITLHAFEADINELSECQHCGWPKEDRRHFVVERHES